MAGKRRGERQCLAIARAIDFGAKVLILDEPTSALGVHQASIVLKLIVQSKASGIGVIFISHNVHHAYVVGDRFTILKRGKSVGTYAKSDISRDELLALMAGGKELVDLEAEMPGSARARRRKSRAERIEAFIACHLPCILCGETGKRTCRWQTRMRLRRDATASSTVAEILAPSPGTCVEDR